MYSMTERKKQNPPKREMVFLSRDCVNLISRSFNGEHNSVWQAGCPLSGSVQFTGSHAALSAAGGRNNQRFSLTNRYQRFSDGTGDIERFFRVQGKNPGFIWALDNDPGQSRIHGIDPQSHAQSQSRAKKYNRNVQGFQSLLIPPTLP
jgi:hypothetical protein